MAETDTEMPRSKKARYLLITVKQQPSLSESVKKMEVSSEGYLFIYTGWKRQPWNQLMRHLERRSLPVGMTRDLDRRKVSAHWDDQASGQKEGLCLLG